jgi:SPP1 gp7 family putative phage head morphogenesis protein
MAIEARFDLAPEEALKYFRSKGLRSGFAWQDVWQSEHDAAFTVAKMADLDLLADVKDAVDRAIAEGRTLAQFRNELTPLLQKRGWWGIQEQVDPANGRPRLVQLGSPRRLETIFRTNLQTAYAAGDWANIQANAQAMPYLMYDAVDDQRTREAHRAWDGLVLRADDPFWQTHRPPNGWNCRCSVIQLSDRQLKRLGKTVGTAPKIETREFVNKRTGEVMAVPRGIDPGWAYNPGAVGRPRQVASNLLEKVAGAHAPLGAAAFERVLPVAQPAIDANWRSWAADVLDTRAGKPQRQVQLFGVMSPLDLQFLRAKGISPVSSELAISDQLLVGKKAARHQQKGDALQREDWLGLATLVAQPEAVLFDLVDQHLVYVGPARGGRRNTKVVVAPDWITGKAPKTRLNEVRTAFRIGVDALRDRKRYEVVRGKL